MGQAPPIQTGYSSPTVSPQTVMSNVSKRLATKEDFARWEMMKKLGITADDMRKENNDRLKKWQQTGVDPGPGEATKKYESATAKR